MNSLTSFSVGISCSVVFEHKGNFIRRNGIVEGRINHEDGVWCIQLVGRGKDEPFYVKANENYFEIIEPMSFFEENISKLDELALKSQFFF